MAKAEWGTKRLCQSCGTKFYDFSKSPIVCPNCGATFDPETLLKSRRGKPAPKEKVAPKPVPEAEDEVVFGGADELAIDEDAADSSDDEDGLAEVEIDEDESST